MTSMNDVDPMKLKDGWSKACKEAVAGRQEPHDTQGQCSWIVTVKPLKR